MNTRDRWELVGPYSSRAIDWIAANVVTDAMVDEAMKRNRHNNYAWELDRTRRNIALGIRCGSFALDSWQTVAPHMPDTSAYCGERKCWLGCTGGPADSGCVPSPARREKDLG